MKINFHMHAWGPWSAPVNASDYVKVQVRYCSACNKCQVARIKQPWNVWFNVPKKESM